MLSSGVFSISRCEIGGDIASGRVSTVMSPGIKALSVLNVQGCYRASSCSYVRESVLVLILAESMRMIMGQL